MKNQQLAYVTVARILRPHGRHGEIASEILTDFPERLGKLSSVCLWDGASTPRPARVLKCWLSHSRGGQAIFHFEGSNSISDAEKLVGLEVQIPLSHRAPLPLGSYYISDLIGCELFSRDGVLLGRVQDVQSMGETVSGTPILTIQSSTRVFEVPLAQDICRIIDILGRRIEVDLPEGLLDLNS